jgi:hypothetical protein
MNSRQDTELQQLYQQSRHQLSDLVFLDDEMKFMKSLIYKLFLPMIHDYHINRVQLINSHLSQLNLVKANVTRDLLVHQGDLFSHTNGVLSKSVDFLRLINERLEAEVNDLNRSLKNIKRELFAVYKELPFQTAQVHPAVS